MHSQGTPAPLADITTISYRGVTLRMRAEDRDLAEQARPLDELLEQFSRDPAGHRRIELVVRREGSGFRLLEDPPSTVNWRCSREDGLVPFLDWAVHQVFADRLADEVGLHAGVAGPDHRPVLLLGVSGAGKSTLTWELLRSGWRYWSDDLAVVSLATYACQPYPKTIKLEGVSEEARAASPAGTIHFPAGPQTYSHIRPWRDKSFIWGQPAPIAAIVELVRGSRETPVTTPLSSRQVFEVLTAYAGFHPERLETEFDVLHHLADRCPGARLALGTTIKENALAVRDFLASVGSDS